MKNILNKDITWLSYEQTILLCREEKLILIKLFTHTDLDGVGCATLAQLAFGAENISIEYCNYDDIDSKVKEFIISNTDAYMIHITDISVTDEVARTIDGKFDNCYLFDHHPTAFGLNEYSWCKVQIEDEYTEIKTCGTEMYYKWLVDNGYLYDSKNIYSFVEVVRNYDTWRWVTLGESGAVSKKVNDLLYLYGKDRFVRWSISEIHDCIFPKFYAADELVLEMKQKEIDSYVEEKNNKIFISPMCGKIAGFVFAEKYFSELGNRLCKMHPEIDFVVMIDMDGTVSYRTVKDDVDLGKDVAKLFGGGGHPKAAGSRFGNEIKLKLLENIFS